MYCNLFNRHQARFFEFPNGEKEVFSYKTCFSQQVCIFVKTPPFTKFVLPSSMQFLHDTSTSTTNIRLTTKEVAAAAKVAIFVY